MEAWITGFQEANPDATVSYDPVGSGGGREQFVAGGTAFAGSDSALADDELKGAQERCGGPDNLLELPVYISPIAIIYNLAGRRQPAALARDRGADLRPEDQELERPGDRGRQPGRHSSRASDITVGQPLRRVWHDRELHGPGSPGRAGATGPYEVSGDWPVKGGEAAEGTSGVVQAVPGRRGRDRLRRLQPGGRARRGEDQGRRRLRRADPGGGREDRRRVQGDRRRRASTCSRSTLNRTHDASRHLPAVLVSYQIACTKYDDADQGTVVSGLLQYIVEPGGPGGRREVGRLGADLRQAPRPAGAGSRGRRAVAASSPIRARAPGDDRPRARRADLLRRSA